MNTKPKKFKENKAKASKGFALPLVIAVGAILLVGGFALMARSFGSLMNSIRAEQATQAREIAEAGIAETIENLNRKYNYLLINCYQNRSTECINIIVEDQGIDYGVWDSPRYPSSVCPGTQRLPYPEFTKQTITPRGSYRIVSYEFDGTQFYGGKGTLTVEGTRNSNGNKVLATAVVQQTFEVKPKNCNGNIKDNANNSGFPGLMAGNINLGGNDVKGSISGNVLCTKCEYANPLEPQDGEERELVDAGNNSEIDGEIFIGEIAAPDVWPIPVEIRKKITQVTDLENSGQTQVIRSLQENINKESGTNSYKITAMPAPQSGETGISHGGMCATDTGRSSASKGEPITYCLMTSAVLSNTEQLEVDTTNGPVKLYVTENVDVGGQRSIKQTRSDGEETTAFRLGLYGLNEAECSMIREDNTDFQQHVKLAGVSKTKKKKNGTGEEPKAANIFVHFPCGKVGIHGGAQNEAECNTDPDDTTSEIPYGDCGGGDIRGVVWAEDWDGSNSNNAQLVVPPGVGDDALNNQGFDYSISVKDYVAIGVNSWFGFGGLLGR